MATESSATRDAADTTAHALSKLSFTLVFASILTVGIAMRILGAWFLRNSNNCDFGIICLMAKHMAEGVAFPVFFYGQAYMGSLEPLAGALFCKLLGFSGFAVCLGTALVAVALLPLVYIWGRSIGGRSVGFGAMAFCAIGPGGYFHYMSSPRGGYAVTLAFTVLILWLTANIASREHNHLRVSWRIYALLGLIAGLAWWSNQLIAPAFLAAALTYLLVLRHRAFRLRVLASIPGFMAGSLPFWWWNVTHHWGSFAMAESLQSGTFKQGWRLLYRERIHQLLDLTQAPATVSILVLVAVGAAFVFAIAHFLHRRSRDGAQEPVVQLGALLLYIVCFALVFSLSTFSRFNTPRYLLPLVPVMAVALSLPLSILARKISPFLAWLPLVGMLGWHSFQIPSFYSRANADGLWMKRVHHIDEWASQTGRTTFFGSFAAHGALNYATAERIAVADPRGERSPPTAERVEHADTVDVLGDYLSAAEFIQQSGGATEYRELEFLGLHYNLRPPTNGVRELPPAVIASITDGSGRNAGALTDANAATSWQYDASTNTWIEIRFTSPADVRRLRLCGLTLSPGLRVKVDVLYAGTDDWNTGIDALINTGYFWSGPRVFCRGLSERWDIALHTPPLSAIKVGFPADRRTKVVKMTELRLYEADERPLVPESDAINKLIRVLDSRREHIRRLYADRWVSNKVRLSRVGMINTIEEKSIYRGVDQDSSHPVVLDSGTALLVRHEDAPSMRRVLASAGASLRETSVGPWILFDADPAGPPLPSQMPRFVWAGFTMFRDGN